jgi:hypothetical protein
MSAVVVFDFVINLSRNKNETSDKIGPIANKKSVGLLRQWIKRRRAIIPSILTDLY